jgi:hypothetical protein
MANNKEYLGDSVYVALHLDGSLELTTENGLGATNTIILELEVYNALLRYVEQEKEKNDTRTT